MYQIKIGVMLMWKTLEEFAEWYKTQGFPIRPPFEDPVYVTDISYSYVLYREGQYQAELYLVRPNTSSPEHSHPGVENIIMVWGGDVSYSQEGVYHDLSEHYTEPNAQGTNKLFGLSSPNLKGTATHALFAGNKGGAFLSLERWPEGKKPSSVTIHWEGEPVDAEHGKIIGV